MRNKKRELIALFIAPISSGATYAFFIFIINLNPSLLVSFAFGSILSYVFSIFIGLPTLIILRKYYSHRLKNYLFAGLISGALCGLLPFLFLILIDSVCQKTLKTQAQQRFQRFFVK